ncbi:GNAT family N-acetyltransferase [Nitrosomonas aestuarii]|uniref:GNAT family N-acetyltransferase n=1 Tax=Nitrosomonas aestuarii TaxID=52441 RepID=UPI000D31A578|nr:GNAT family N-acetyltransferase [Nitrosomonas aestuarii]PTN11469.1 ribosomal protein S18 acetylase RimI-like enzyme [Nitrosomonas aestuarii]
MPEILPLTKHDTPTISSLARKIWLRQYQNILSIEQINYMLAQRYCPMLIQSQLVDERIWWKKLVLDNTIIGFSCCVLTAVPGELKIDKLYICHDHHRQGYGKMLIEDAVSTLYNAACNKLILTVNKQNYTAIHAYQRYGFGVVGDSVVDIGGGFFMNDYLMTMIP